MNGAEAAEAAEPRWAGASLQGWSEAAARRETTSETHGARRDAASARRVPADGAPPEEREEAEAEGARWAGASRGWSEASRRETQTAAGGGGGGETSTSGSRRDAFGRRIPSDAVEIKVQMNGREFDERSGGATEERWTCAERSFGGAEADGDQWTAGGGRGRPREGGREEENAGMASRGVERSRVAAGGKSAGKTGSTDDGRVWIPVIHVSAAGSDKPRAKSDTSPAGRSAEEVSPVPRRPEREVLLRSEETVRLESPGQDRPGPDRSGPAESRKSPRGAAGGAAAAAAVYRAGQDRSPSAAWRETPSGPAEGGASAAAVAMEGSPAATPSLRTGSGVGSYGYRSSIVVERAPAESRGGGGGGGGGCARSSTGSDGEWMVEKAKAV